MSRVVDRCPACGADALALWHDADGDGTGTWAMSWFACDDCGHRLRAEQNALGVFVPVDDDEEAAG